LEENRQEQPELIEVAQLEGLVAAAGKDVTLEIVDAFWRSTERLLTALANDLRSGALDNAAKSAHAIKGSASNIGAAKLSHTAALLETACRGNDAEGANSLFSESNADFDAARTEITEYLKRCA